MGQCHPRKGASESEAANEVPLFFSETYQPLTINALTLLCGRLRKRAGFTEERVNPSVLRATFAVRYLQAGGDPEALREIPGLAHVMSVTCYQHLIDGQSEKQKEPAAEEQPERRKPSPPITITRRQRWRRSSSMTTKGPQKRVQGGASGSHGSTENTPYTRAGDDP